MLFLVPSRRFFSGVLSLPTQKSASHPAWEKTVQFSLPPTLRHHHSNNLFCSKYRIPPFFFLPWQQSTSHTYSLVHYLHCTFNIYSFQPNACCPPPRTKRTQPMSTNGANPSEALPSSPPNVPSKLRYSCRGYKIGLEMLRKHTHWGSFDIIYTWWRWHGRMHLQCVVSRQCSFSRCLEEQRLHKELWSSVNILIPTLSIHIRCFWALSERPLQK